MLKPHAVRLLSRAMRWPGVQWECSASAATSATPTAPFPGAQRWHASQQQQQQQQPPVLVEDCGDHAVVTLNRPGSLNALSSEVRRAPGSAPNAGACHVILHAAPRLAHMGAESSSSTCAGLEPAARAAACQPSPPRHLQTPGPRTPQSWVRRSWQRSRASTRRPACAAS